MKTSLHTFWVMRMQRRMKMLGFFPLSSSSWGIHQTMMTTPPLPNSCKNTVVINNCTIREVVILCTRSIGGDHHVHELAEEGPNACFNSIVWTTPCFYSEHHVLEKNTSAWLVQLCYRAFVTRPVQTQKQFACMTPMQPG